MSLLIAFAVVLIGASIVAVLADAKPGEPPSPELTKSWDQALRDADGPLTGGLARMARSVGGTRYVQDAAQTKALSPLAGKVVASGLFGQSLEVFLAYQATALLVGMALLVFVVLVPMSLMLKLAVLAIGVVIAVLPFDKVRRAAKEKGEAAAEALPDFVELLRMALAAGMMVRPALKFTAAQTDGVIADQARWLEETLQLGRVEAGEAFREAGQRIGTPEAAAFFIMLGQAHLSGTKVLEPLTKQADSLRTQAYQARRAKVKKLPVSLIVAFAVHFLPLLFIIAMLPLAYSMVNLGK